MSYKCKYGSMATSSEYEPSWHLHTYESTFPVPQDIKSRCAFPFLQGIIFLSNQTSIRDGDVRPWLRDKRWIFKKYPDSLNILGCVQKWVQHLILSSPNRPSAACHSLDIQNYPAEEQGTHWDKTKKDFTILNDVTSLFVLFVLVSSRAILYHVNDQLRRADSNWTSFKTLPVKIYPGDHYIIIIVTREPKPVLKLKFVPLYWM